MTTSKTYHDIPYIDMVDYVLRKGVEKGDRTGTGTLSVFGYQMRFNLNDHTIPMLTTKKMFTRGIIHELIWYLNGDTNIKYLVDNGVHIWDEWADKNGDLGPIYGKQWRAWPGPDGDIDQIEQVMRLINEEPDSRRMIVNAWNVADLAKMNLPPCHALFQFNVADGKLNCQLYQRSCDVGLGVPFNIVQYSILTHMIAYISGLELGDFVWTGGDVHIYTNHIDALKEQLQRTPYASPTLEFARSADEIGSIDGFVPSDFEFVGYRCHPTIKMEVSV